MISKTDCMAILVKLEDSGFNADYYMKKLLVSKEIPLDVLQFIAKNRGIEISNFYEMLRKSHNTKKSPLYVNILKDEHDANSIITTLSCLLTQIILYNKKLTSENSFIKDARAEEITRVLNNYFKNNDISQAVALLKLIKSDILVLEYYLGRRDLSNN